MVVVAQLFGAMPAYAWGWEGHQIIARLASARLTPGAKAQVDALLALEPGATLESISTFADVHRSPETAPLHYVNFPRGDCNYEPARDCPEGQCVVAAIERNYKTLKNGASPEERLLALKYLVHFVGDVHQPLHAGFVDDRGGNGYELQDFMRSSNLHAVWDSGLIKYLNESVDALASQLASMPVPRIASDLDPVHMAQESCRITSLGGFYPNRIIDMNYLRRFTPVMQTRLVAAGARLAAMLNGL